MATDTRIIWSNIVAALGSAIVSTLLTAWYFQGFATGKKEVPSGVSGAFAGAGVLAVETITYIPHILLLFGVLADMFTMEGVYSIPSLVGLLTIPLNYLMSFFWTGVLGVWQSIQQLYNISPNDVKTPFTGGPTVAESPAKKTPEPEVIKMIENPLSTKPGSSAPKKPAPERARPQLLRSLEEFGPKMDGGAIEKYDGCDVQGFTGLSSQYAPQTLVVTATVFLYYIFDLITNRGWASASASIVLFGVLYIAETFIIGDCGYGLSKWTRSFIAFLEGLLFGGTAYAVVQNYYPSKLPSAVLPSQAKETTPTTENAPSTTEVSAMMGDLYTSPAA
jgi:hypothetical protein